MTQERTDRRGVAAPGSTYAASRSRFGGLTSRLARRHSRWIVTFGLAASYVLVTVAVHLRLLDDLDVAVLHAARPGGVWGPVQIRSASVAGAFRPTHLAAPLVLVVTAFSVHRRSPR